MIRIVVYFCMHAVYLIVCKTVLYSEVFVSAEYWCPPLAHLVFLRLIVQFTPEKLIF